MTSNLKSSVTASLVIGSGISAGLILLSWFNPFATFVPQLPGFLVSSSLWGMPGFAHDTAHHVQLQRGGFLFPYLMALVNAVFYGALAFLVSSIFKRSTATFDSGQRG